MYPEQRQEARDGWVLVYVLVNLALVGFDVAYAHMPAYGRTPFLLWPVWATIPFIALAVYLLWPFARERAFGSLDQRRRQVLRAVVIAAIVVGAVGAWFHFDSQRVWGYTLERFVFSAPILAPLMYAGLGGMGLIYLDLHDRSRRHTHYWLAASAGLAANAVVLLLDHAQNGFLHWAEIAGGALAFVPAPLALWTALAPSRASLVKPNRAVAGLLAVVGLVGLALHLGGVIGDYGLHPIHWHDGAPPAAPALLVDYALLIFILTLAEPE